MAQVLRVSHPACREAHSRRLWAPLRCDVFAGSSLWLSSLKTEAGCVSAGRVSVAGLMYLALGSD